MTPDCRWLELIAGIVGDLAWPITVFLILKQFRTEIGSAIQRIRNARYRDAEINLEQEMSRIKNDAEMAGIPISYPASSVAMDSIKSIELAPEWAFIESWQEIENLLMRLQAELSEGEKRKVPIASLTQELVKDGVIDPAVANLIEKLRKVRNRVVHSDGHDVTRGEAFEWLGISRSVMEHLTQKLD